MTSLQFIRCLELFLHSYTFLQITFLGFMYFLKPCFTLYILFCSASQAGIIASCGNCPLPFLSTTHFSQIHFLLSFHYEEDKTNMYKDNEITPDSWCSFLPLEKLLFNCQHDLCLFFPFLLSTHISQFFSSFLSTTKKNKNKHVRRY